MTGSLPNAATRACKIAMARAGVPPHFRGRRRGSGTQAPAREALVQWRMPKLLRFFDSFCAAPRWFVSRTIIRDKSALS